MKHIFESKQVSLEVKMRLFHSHIQSIFLYNSELWTLTKKLESTVDVFQRNILRKILDIRWPKKISNNTIYETTKAETWSKTIKRRRLQWYGHLLRLPENTPAKEALKEARSFACKPKGGQKLTWLKIIDRDLKDIQIKVVVANSGGGVAYSYNTKDHKVMAQNRYTWQVVVNRAMSQ